MNQKGLTIIEVLIVIVVTGIIAGFALVTVSGIVNASEEKADLNNLQVLNDATENYIMFEGITTSDAFDSIGSDLDRLSMLLSTGYIDKRVIPQQENSSFGWNIDSQEWQLFIDGNPYSKPSDGYDFNNISIDDAKNDGMYVYQDSNITYDEDNGRLVFDPKKGKAFTNTDSDEYSFSVTWSSENLNDARILFMFDYYDESNLDKGDGYSILFRKNTNFVRLHRVTNGTRFSNAVTYYTTSSGIIPDYRIDDTWYGLTHTCKFDITRVNATTKNVAIYVDGEYLTSFNYTQEVQQGQVYYGVSNIKRTDSEAYVYSIN